MCQPRCGSVRSYETSAESQKQERTPHDNETSAIQYTWYSEKRDGRRKATEQYSPICGTCTKMWSWSAGGFGKCINAFSAELILVANLEGLSPRHCMRSRKDQDPQICLH